MTTQVAPPFSGKNSSLLVNLFPQLWVWVRTEGKAPQFLSFLFP